MNKIEKRKQRIAIYVSKRSRTPEDFTFEYIGSGSLVTDIRLMKEYVRNINRLEKEYNKKYPIKCN